MSNPGETTRKLPHVPKDELPSVIAGIIVDPLFIRMEKPVLEEPAKDELYTLRTTYRELPDRPT